MYAFIVFLPCFWAFDTSQSDVRTILEAKLRWIFEKYCVICAFCLFARVISSFDGQKDAPNVRPYIFLLNERPYIYFAAFMGVWLWGIKNSLPGEFPREADRGRLPTFPLSQYHRRDEV